MALSGRSSTAPPSSSPLSEKITINFGIIIDFIKMSLGLKVFIKCKIESKAKLVHSAKRLSLTLVGAVFPFDLQSFWSFS